MSITKQIETLEDGSLTQQCGHTTYKMNPSVQALLLEMACASAYTTTTEVNKRLRGSYPSSILSIFAQEIGLTVTRCGRSFRISA